MWLSLNKSMTIQYSEIGLVHMNKASMIINYKGLHYFISRNLFNKLLKAGFLENVTILEIPTSNLQNVLKWVAVPSLW
jgi:hypothetical protein